jgi:hypothetical protein
MKIARLPRVLIWVVCAAALPGCSVLRTGGPCYGYGCPAGAVHEEPKAAENVPAPATNAPGQNSNSDSANQTKSADATSHKHGLLAKLHLTHGD